MKFKGELKFPEVDHPGVPVEFLIDGDQAELVVDDESLGRWSLYDIHARRLVASAFQIDLDGTEVTFVANDPIDFAYRGVEHMAESWAGIKSKRLATRSLAIRKSRKGTTPSRVEDLREAMESNLETVEPRRIAGETSGLRGIGAADREEETESWDDREEAASIPAIGGDAAGDQTATPDSTEIAAQRDALEQERRRLEEERARLEEQRRATEERESNLVEAYRLEMQRLEVEREELLRQGGGTETADETSEPTTHEPEQPAAEISDFQPETVPRSDEPEPEPVADEEPELVEPEPEPVAEEEPELVEPELVEPEPEPVAEEEPEPAEPEPVTAAGVLDLNDYEDGDDGDSGAGTGVVPRSEPEPEPEPALAGVAKEKRNGGIMGAVRAAFRSGPRDHDHQFIEAPGGIGITRYVCEECGYVSIGAGD